MAPGLNKVMLIGSVGRDPEMRYLPSGRPVSAFSLGVTRGWVNPAGEHCNETEWFNVVAWGDLAEVCKRSLSAGQHVYVEGRLHTRSWEDGEGRKRARVEVIANGMVVLGGQRGSAPGEAFLEQGEVVEDLF